VKQTKVNSGASPTSNYKVWRNIMSAFINTNTASLNAQRNLNTSQSSLTTSLQRLSSGLRINSAKDDAAGLAISERFTTQIRGISQAARNANDGISLAQTAEGTLGEIGNNLQRMRELAVQSRNSTNSTDDRAALDTEVQQLKAEIGRVAGQANFNGSKLLDGSFTNKTFQVGANQGETISIPSIVNANTSQLGSWTAPAVVTGSTAPAGSGVAAATAGDSTAAGAFTAPASGVIGETYSISVAGVSVFSSTSTATSGAGSTFTAASVDAAVTANSAALTAAGITTSGTFAAGTAKFTKADGTDFNITVANTFSTTAGGFAGTDFVTGSHSVTSGTPAVAGTFGAAANVVSINGTNISVGAAADAGARVDDLVKAINTNVAGVTASKDANGKLAMTSSAPIVIATVTGTNQAAMTAATGLGSTAGTGTGTTNGTATVGFASENVLDAASADKMILAMDAALKDVNSARAGLGAVQNRFSSVIANLQTTSENLSASRSRIQDTDFASETASLTRGQILQQAGTAMLAQANSLPNGVLALLRG
jgi:flagellin